MIGVIIARFQTPYLHPGHVALIESVLSKHKRCVIVLGISPALGSKKNPLDFHTREKMIKKSFPDVIVLPLADHPLDTAWSANLDMLLTNTFPHASFTLYGGRKSFIEYYSGRNAVHELPSNGDFSATELREAIQDQVVESIEFRSGIIYAYANTYEKVYPTVDIAVFRKDRSEILLGKKQNDGKWRLIGGFADPSDKSFESAAMRELQEECGPIEVSSMQYEGSFQVDDWRYRNERDKIITTLFSTDHISGEPSAQDDIAEVRWFALEKLHELLERKETTPTHEELLSHLIRKYVTKIPSL
jgi:bifunctional NMN adenylyltransferase/nudix hydrolase